LDCRLLDLHRAKVSGFDGLGDSRSPRIHTPVIVITARDELSIGKWLRAHRTTLLAAIDAGRPFLEATAGANDMPGTDTNG
jgi:hypothetical protein